MKINTETMLLMILERVTDVATGRTPHLFEGDCPTEHDTKARDPYCAACNAIVAAEKVLGFKK